MGIVLTHTRRFSYRTARTLRKILASCPGFEAYTPDDGFPVFFARPNSKKDKNSAAGFLSGCLLFEPENGVRVTLSDPLALTGIEVSAAIRPSYRRQGLFTDLLKEAVDFSRQRYPGLPLTGPLPDYLAHSRLTADPVYQELLMQLLPDRLPDHLPDHLPGRLPKSLPGHLAEPQTPVPVKTSCQDELVQAACIRETSAAFIWQLFSCDTGQYIVYGQPAAQGQFPAPGPFSASGQLTVQSQSLRQGQLLAQLSFSFGLPWCVSDVWVPKEKRGNGYASLLLFQVLSHLSGLCSRAMPPVFLQVRDSNVPALKTYQGLGFKTVQQQRFYRFDRLFS